MTKRMNRRIFLGKAATGLACAGSSLPLFGSRRQTEENPPKLVFRTLGRTGFRIPIVSFGVMNSDSQDLIRRALDMGINHLDTASVYLRGNSERSIGEVLKSRGNRDKIYLATKMRFNRDNDKAVFLTSGNGRDMGASPENFNKQLEASLLRLQTDYLDILYLHSCYSPAMASYEPLLNLLVKAKEQGKTRFIGVSSHRDEPNVIRAAVDLGVYDVVLTAYNSILEYREEVRKSAAYAVSKGVGVVAMKVLGGREKAVKDLDSQAAMKWVMNDKNVCTAIMGMTSFDQLDLNLKVMSDPTLTAQDQKALEKTLDPGSLFYCQYCRSCLGTCTRGVEIPKLMRASMYAHAYRNNFQAAETIASLSKTKGLAACSECDSCTARCRLGLPIAARLKALLEDNYHLA